MTNKKGSPASEATPKNLHSNSNLPLLPGTIEERVELLLEHRLSPQKRRLVEYLKDHPDAWTHELSQNCAVGYPPNRLGELNKEILPRYGLYLLCHTPDKWLKNRYGEKSMVHQWRFVLSPQGKQAAA